MARTLHEAPITTRAARSRLGAGTHWRGIDPDTHLGYRRGQRGGKWVVRWRDGKGYQQATLGVADDELVADGASTFDFSQATRIAKRHVQLERAECIAAAAGRLETVATAVADYSLMRQKRVADRPGGRGKDAEQRLRKHVLEHPIASKPLHLLLEDDLRSWRADLPETVSPNTVRRLGNDFKAALNLAAKVHRAKLPPSLPLVVKNGLGGIEVSSPVARDMQVLADEEVRDIIKAAWEIDAAGKWEGDFGRLVVVLAATGARFGQAVAMRVGDVQTAHGRVMVPPANKGRGTKASSRIAVRVGDDILRALRPAIAGRKASAPLFERWRHKQVAPARWERTERGAWTSSSEMARPWRLAVAKAEMPSDTIPYALRHSSIVRGLRAGLPVRLVAALHDTSSSMIEAHYSAFIVDALDALAAAAVIPLTEPVRAVG